MTTSPEQHKSGPWKCGNEFLPYHPSASHVNPDYRDGWNACYEAGRASMLRPIPEVEGQPFADEALRQGSDLEPNLSPTDNGPWGVIEWGSEGFAVLSDQFDFDAALVVNGDFVNDREKEAYAEMIAAKLNSTRQPPPSNVEPMP